MARNGGEKAERKTESPSEEAGAPGAGAPNVRPAFEWLKSLLIAVLLFVLIRTFLLQTFVIVSGSMEDDLLIGDFLVANRLAVGSRIPGTSIRIPGYSEPRRGDVMVFEPHHEENIEHLVKRLIGLSGDTLEMRDGTMMVNGEVLSEPYLSYTSSMDERRREFAWQLEYLTDDVDRTTYEPSLGTWGPLVVPTDHFFMLGDNRDNSLDSRFWGPLASWRVEARVSFIYYSYDRESYRPFSFLREIRWSRFGPFRSPVA